MTGVKRLSFKGDSSAPSKKRKRPAATSTKLDAVKPTTQLQAPTDNDEEGWITARQPEDLHGPLMLCYNRDRPVAISADANGRVFLTELEGPMETLAMAEPHEVRQVFVVARLPQEDGTVQATFKSSMGQYLSADRFGEVVCKSEAVGPAETWQVIQRPDGWALQSVHDLFLSIGQGTAKDGSEDGIGKESVRCDEEAVGFCETFTIRTQARYRQQPPATQKAAASQGKTKVLSKKELEGMTGRTLTMDQVDDLRAADRAGALHEAVLDLRVRGKSDKFG